MLQSFRNFFKSKFGVAFTLVFLVLVALAFASSDVANTGSFGGLSAGDSVAVVGDTDISPTDLSLAASNALDEARQRNPTATMASFMTEEGINTLLDQLVQRAGVAEFGKSIGLRAGDRLVDSQMLQIPAFQGADGNFSQAAYQAFISQNRLSDATIREDLAAGLFAKQLLLPATFGLTMPNKVTRRYAGLLTEQREGEIGLIEASTFAPEEDPTEEQLTSYYSENSSDYLRPERRVIRYAVFGADALGDLPAPTASQIEARFKRDANRYAAVENRSLRQLVLPTEAAAKAVLDEVNGGKSLAASASEKGLATADVGPVTKEELTGQASAAVANAAFGANEGALVGPARGPLGWYVIQVRSVERRDARTLAEVRDEISAALAEEQKTAALADLTANVEDELYNGSTLTEVAEDVKAEVASTEPATADGLIYQKQGETIPGELRPVLSTAFTMEEEEPQLAVLVPGEMFMIYDVTDITPSAAAPLAEIEDRVKLDWRRAQGNAKARAAADKVLAALDKGTSMSDALKAQGIERVQVDTIDMNRQQLQQAAQASGGQVPPVLALLFSMAKGTSKKLEAPGNRGWFIASLDEITPGDVAEDDPRLLSARNELGELAKDELSRQLANAMLAEVGYEANPAGVTAVFNQITGRSEQ